MKGHLDRKRDTIAAMKALEPKLPRITELRAHVGARPRIKAYLDSPRRLPHNEHDLCRAYPELDLPV